MSDYILFTLETYCYYLSNVALIADQHSIGTYLYVVANHTWFIRSDEHEGHWHELSINAVPAKHRAMALLLT